MKILVINGSPKKENSNTLLLTKSFLAGIQSKRDVVIQQINIYDSAIVINDCIGCFNCWTKTPGKCIFSDTMAGYLDEYISSDLVIWSFPLYYFGLPSKAKAFMDRLLPLNQPLMTKGHAGHVERYDLSHQKHVVISSGGLSTITNNFESVEKMFDIMLQGGYSKIFTPQSPLLTVKALQRATTPYLETVRSAGEYHADNFCFSKELQNALNTQLFPIDVYNKMADASWKISENGSDAKLEKLFSSTKQMASLYNSSSYHKDIVLEMDYTDYNEKYQIVITQTGAKVINKNFLKYTTKIETPFTVWSDISEGKITGSSALMEGKYKVLGDLDLMMNWNTYFGYDTPQALTAPSSNKVNVTQRTNMNMMLIPFITFWVALPFSHLYGDLISIIVSLLLPVLFCKIKFTVYDKVSALIIGVLALLTTIGFSYDIILPISYLSFALLWLISLLTKVPLSANYSNNDFGGEKAYENAIFMKTNAILTLCWGVLYVLLSVFTFFAVKTALQPYLVIINNLPPILLGIFTRWFQGWYPKKVMMGI